MMSCRCQWWLFCVLIRPCRCAVQLVLNVLHCFRARLCEGEALLTQQTSCMGAACGSLCRELCRKMQPLIFKLERAKCLIFGLLCTVFPVTLLCYFRTIHQLTLGDPGVGSLECSSTMICSFTAVHLFSLPFLLCFSDWRFHLMQKDMWLVVLAVRSTSALPIFAGWLSFTLCGYWGLKCDLTKKDDQNFFCMTWWNISVQLFCVYKRLLYLCWSYYFGCTPCCL